MKPKEDDMVNDIKIRRTEGDGAVSAVIRKEYELLGGDIQTLADQVGCGKYHARSLWNGEVTWHIPELMKAMRLPHFAEGVEDPTGYLLSVFTDANKQ